MVNLFLLLLSTLFKLSHSVMFDSGNLTNMFYPSSCTQGQTRTATITFNKEFTNIPQVAVFPMTYDITTQNEFNFSIGNITLTKFDYLISCTFNTVAQFGFYWRAIDDWRIQVVDCFNKNVSGLGNTTFTLSHSNSNAVKGFVIPQNFGFTGEIFFSLDIQSITYSNVVVSLTQNTTNLLSIGFQIVLCSDSSYLIESPQTMYNLVRTDPPIIYTNIPQKNQYQLFIICKSLNNPNQAYGTRLDYNIMINDNTTLSYSVRTWYYTTISSITYQFIWMNLRAFSPMVLSKMRQAKLFSFQLPSNYVSIQILEITQSFTTIGSYPITLDSSIQNLNLKIQFHCYEALKVSGSILKCLSCQIQNKIWQQNCYSNMNSQIYYIKLYQADKINQQIQLILNSQSVALYQQDINNPASNFTILNVGLENQ